MNETKVLAEYLSNLTFEDLSPVAISTAKNVVRDMLGVGLFASRLPWSSMAADYALEAGGTGRSTVWGREGKTAPAFAAMANGTAAHGIEMDERIHGLPLHNGSPTVAAALALAEHTGSSGRDLILAIVCSYELAVRVSRASQGNAVRYVTGNANILGAATAGAKLLRLDAEGIANTLGIAGGTFTGVSEYANDPHGTMVKRLQGGGWPAHIGVSAALLAQKGFTGPSTILEGKHGVLRAFKREGEPDPSALTRNLGDGLEIALWETKWYAAWGGSHSSIEAVSKLQAAHAFEPEQVARIDVGICSRILVNTEKARPDSILAAQHNLPFVIAAAFYYDLHDPTSWQETILHDERVLSLADKISFHVDAEIDAKEMETHDLGGSRLSVELTDGRRLQTEVLLTKGTLDYPLTEAELESKFRMMSGAALPDTQVDGLSKLLGHLEDYEGPIELSLAQSAAGRVDRGTKRPGAAHT